MAVLDLFSKRQRRLRGEVPDVYRYDDLPRQLRVQIVHIIYDVIGDPDDETYGLGYANSTFERLVEALCRERGIFELGRPENAADTQLVNYFLREKDVELALDVVELCFSTAPPSTIGAQVEDLNTRFREHGVGYQFEPPHIVRVDSQLVHTEVVKPALVILHDPMFEGPEQEYRQAHQHYRHGRYKESLVECLKAFESTMKAIADAREWDYKPSLTAKGLIQMCLDNGLVPQWMQTQFTSLKSLLESGVPTARNKMAAHGQGASVQGVPEHLAAYGLHLAASNIVFLARAHRTMGR